jgi:hypothetical protein
MGGGLATHFMLNQMDQTKASLAEEFKKKQLDTQHRQGEVRGLEIKNLFEEQKNPLEVEGARITNRNNTAIADKNASEARVVLGTEQFKLNAAQRAELAQMSDHELKMAENQAWLMMQSPNPEHRAAAKNFIEGTKEFAKSRFDSDLTAGRERFLEDGRNTRAKEQNQTSIKVANIGAASREALAAARKTQTSYDGELLKRSPAQQVIALKQLLTIGRHPATGEPLSEIEREGYQARYDKAVQVVDATPAPSKEDAVLKIGPDGKPILGAPSPRQSVGDKKKLTDEELLKLYGVKK